MEENKIEKKPCPLTKGEWLQFFENVLSIQHSFQPVIYNILIVTMIFIGTVFIAQIDNILPKFDLNNIKTVVSYLISAVILFVIFIIVITLIQKKMEKERVKSHQLLSSSSPSQWVQP